jgi:hypothetical protein
MFKLSSGGIRLATPATAEEKRRMKRHIKKQLAIYEVRFTKEGSSDSLLLALDWCLRTATPVPLWVANAFCDRMLLWLAAKAPTLDTAFGVKPLHHNTLKANRKRIELAPSIVAEIGRRYKESGKSPTAIIGELADEFGIGETKIWAYYGDPEMEWLRAIYRLPKRTTPR